MTKAVKPRHRDCLKRLSRIEGQVRGVSRMVDEQRYCIDILTQLSAIKAALNKVEAEILKDHADHCVADAIQSGDEAEQKQKFNELVELFGRYK
ncbi:MAG: metal-sensitive transcriptional regulator [Hyphomicrobiales bacterium]|nr:metal-sensitive transcriptional regulator [Hyphomicrobiales bacterium]